MINLGLNSVLINTLHSTYRRKNRKKISSSTFSNIYPNRNTSRESWEEYNKRRIKEDELEAKILFYIALIGVIGVITLIVCHI